MRRFHPAPLACAALLAFEAPAATLDQWGNLAVTGSYSCAAAVCNIIDFVGDPNDLDPPGLGVMPGNLDGGNMAMSAASEIGPLADPNGTARAQAMLVGGLSAPELRAEAYSNAGGGTVGFAFGAQGYTYLGGSGTVSLSIDLTGAIVDTVAQPTLTPAEEQILIDLGLDPAGTPDLTRLEAMGAIFVPGSGFSTAILELLSGFDPLAGLSALDLYTAIDSVTLIEDVTNPAIANTGNLISITGLQPGDEFYLFTALLASSDGAGNYADAFSTLGVEFTVGGNEVAAAVQAVPLPAAAWLFAPLAAALLARRRRRAGS